MWRKILVVIGLLLVMSGLVYANTIFGGASSIGTVIVSLLFTIAAVSAILVTEKVWMDIDKSKDKRNGKS
ncbi:hypothetical protein Voja6_00049 [Pseudomonas phage vB_PpuM-Voja-6]